MKRLCATILCLLTLSIGVFNVTAYALPGGENVEALISSVSERDAQTATDGESEDGENDSESNEEGTTVVTTAPPDNGGFEVSRDFDDDTLKRLYEIRRENEERKQMNGNTVFATLASISGIVVMLYSLLVLVAFILDKFNNFIDIDLVKLVTFGHACTIKSDSDIELVNSKLYIFTTKRIIINTIIGVCIGAALTCSSQIMEALSFILDTITGGCFN